MKRFFAAIGLGLLVAGCGKTDAVFVQLKQASAQELQAKTQANSAWGLGRFDSWSLDQDSGWLVFSNADGTVAKAPAQIIGSYDSSDHSWQWAWDNPSVASALKTDSQKVKTYGEQMKAKSYGERPGFDKLTQAGWQGSEDDAWAMAAIACKICGSQGIYRGPVSTNLFVFISFGEVKISKAK